MPAPQEKFQTKYLAQSKTATGAPDLNPALEQAGRLLQDAADGVLDYNQLKNFRSSLMKLRLGRLSHKAL